MRRPLIRGKARKDSTVRCSCGSPQDFGWLTGSRIHEEVTAGRISIDPYDSSYVNPNSYNYRLSSHLKRLTSEVIDCRAADEFESIEIPEEGFILQPGECYLGATEEIFGSDVYASLVTGRSSVGRKFVTNHITAGLIDQGFFGNITLEIVAYKPTRIYVGMTFGQIFWFTTSGDPYLYNGKYQRQSGPTLSKLGEDFNPIMDDRSRIEQGYAG
jgi:deoxycytidine triphosphate deaminase